jgi:hypothetical protein
MAAQETRRPRYRLHGLGKLRMSPGIWRRRALSCARRARPRSPAWSSTSTAASGCSDSQGELQPLAGGERTCLVLSLTRMFRPPRQAVSGVLPMALAAASQRHVRSSQRRQPANRPVKPRAKQAPNDLYRAEHNDAWPSGKPTITSLTRAPAAQARVTVRAQFPRLVLDARSCRSISAGPEVGLLRVMDRRARPGGEDSGGVGAIPRCG